MPDHDEGSEQPPGSDDDGEPPKEGVDAQSRDDARANIAKLNPFILPSGDIKRPHVTSCHRGTTPPVYINNPDVPFFDPFNHECPRSDNTVHNQTHEYDGWTALHAAAQSTTAGVHGKMLSVQGDVDQVRFLLGGRGHHVPASVAFPHYSSPALDVDSREVKRGFAPLHVAVCAGHPAVVQVLIKHKASADARDCLGRTPIHWGCELDAAECVGMLLGKEGGGWSLGALTFCITAIRGLGELVASNTDGELQNFFVEITTTHTDPRDPPPQPIKLPNGAVRPPPAPPVNRRVQTTPGARTYNGTATWKHASALVFRLCPEDTQIQLRLFTADLDDRKEHLGTWRGSREDAEKCGGTIPIELSEERGRVELVADVTWVRALNAQDDNGESALMLAAAKGSLECTKLLLEAGARVDLRDKFGVGAVYRASTAGYADVCWLIEDRGGLY